MVTACKWRPHLPHESKQHLRQRTPFMYRARNRRLAESVRTSERRNIDRRGQTCPRDDRQTRTHHCTNENRQRYEIRATVWQSENRQARHQTSTVESSGVPRGFTARLQCSFVNFRSCDCTSSKSRVSFYCVVLCVCACVRVSKFCKA
jgi:hypothetical protein